MALHVGFAGRETISRNSIFLRHPVALQRNPAFFVDIRRLLPQDYEIADSVLPNAVLPM